MLSDYFSKSHGLQSEGCNDNWDVLLQEAATEFLLPAMADRIRSLQIEASLPVEILNIFVAAETLNAERNAAMKAEAVHVAGLLNKIGLQPLALKGLAYILTGVYPNLATRYLRDLDLLLPRHEHAAAIPQLRRHGYLESESEKLLRFFHHYPAIRRSGHAPVEIHHRVGQGICARLLPVDILLANSKPLTVAGATFRIPSPTDLVNHLILHSQLAHPYRERMFPPLRGLVDLLYLDAHYGSQIDWASLTKTYRDNRQSATLILYLRQANSIVGFKQEVPLSLFMKARYQRRLLLNRYPNLRFFDPIYMLMSVFSRRLRLVPEMLRAPSSWIKIVRHLTRTAFYRDLSLL